jgi:hypothetical protein
MRGDKTSLRKISLGAPRPPFEEAIGRINPCNFTIMGGENDES